MIHSTRQSRTESLFRKIRNSVIEIGEPMGRLLDEDMVINALQTTKFRNDLFVDRGYARAISIIKEPPTIQPEKAQLSTEGTTKDATSDLISRQAVINAIENTNAKMSMPEWDEITNAVMSLPTVQPKPHEGHWISVFDEDDDKCSECQATFFCASTRFNFCPNCGAKMKGAQNG